ncbi:hypothetical protein EPN96_04600 [bacterium]|nr:MAG: hypothetical protein EPN96_04600 [bacterium]
MGGFNNTEAATGDEKFKAFGLGFVGPNKGSHNPSTSGRHLYESGVWSRDASISARLGQVVWITVKNVNAIGTTIEITSNNGGRDAAILLPYLEAEFRFDNGGAEPLFWHFEVRTESDAFLVNYTIESTWVPGMEENR